MSFELKVKEKSLAAEIIIIKKEEAKQLRFARRQQAAKGKWESFHREQYNALRSHRCGCDGTVGIRREARSTHLARAFIQGLPYVACEQRRYTEPNWAQVTAMVKRYADRDGLLQDLTRWKNEGEAAVIDYKVTPKKQKVKEVT